MPNFGRRGETMEFLSVNLKQTKPLQGRYMRVVAAIFSNPPKPISIVRGISRGQFSRRRRLHRWNKGE